jgi:P2 family phage contractile tail tube protein
MRSGIAKVNNIFMPYDDGERLEGTVTVELPNFELMSETWKGAGGSGEVNVPTSVMSALTATISAPVIYGALSKYFALGKTRTIDLRNEIIVTNTDNHAQEKVPNRWVLKGVLSGANPGSIEQGAAGDAQLTMQVYYAKHYLDGDEVLEWDCFKHIFRVNGEDLMAATRQNVLVG